MFAGYSHLNRQTFVGLVLKYRKHDEKKRSPNALTEDSITIGDCN